jgi:copper resistance protein B
VAFTGLSAAELDDQLFTLVDIDRLEYRAQDGNDSFAWEGQARVGGDFNKIAVKSEGEYIFETDAFEEAEVQFLYQRLISDFFDAQLGIRYDFKPDPSRAYAVLGINGLAPQWFEVDGSAFLSDEGDLSMRFEAEYDLLITQRLIVGPSVELNVAFSDDQAVGIAAGVNDVELGLRLRYEFAREFAPYLGVNWERLIGNTADLARDEGEDVDTLSFVAGVRIFF